MGEGGSSMNTFLHVASRAVLGLLIPMLVQAADVPSIAGTYKLMKRTLPDGTTITSPAVVGLMTFTGGFRNFNVSWKGPDGKPVSLSLIAEYTLGNGKFCEKFVFRAANNLSNPGLSYEVPAEAKSCSPVTVKDGKVTFQMPDEPPIAIFERDGMVATAAGHFVDYWKKID
jgi:hypothetical protein